VAGFSFKKILTVISEVRADSGAAARLCVVGEGPAVRDVARSLSAGAADAVDGFSASLDVLGPADMPHEAGLLRRWRLVVLVAPGCDAAGAARVVSALRAARVGVVALVPDRDTPAGSAWLAAAGLKHAESVASLGRPGEPKPSLQGRLATVLEGDGLALAQRLPALRHAVADRIVLAAARQNGVIGVVVIVPGADMPAMTLNQIRMVLRIATVYGEELGLDRALEILSVAGAGLMFRTLARQALDFVPGFGWAVKGAVGFSGTVALGSAAIEYFEAGAPLTTTRFTKLAGTVDRFRRVLPFRGVAAG